MMTPTLKSTGDPCSVAPAFAVDDQKKPMVDLIELFFFAYRDFVGDADRLLEKLEFGRAHHRVLHFVDRRPGLTITELLEILGITKQSLARVLKDLVEGGYIETQSGVTDRRQRLLFPTIRGRSLSRDLLHLQSERFARAFTELGDGARQRATDFLFALINESEKTNSLSYPSSDNVSVVR